MGRGGEGERGEEGRGRKGRGKKGLPRFEKIHVMALRALHIYKALIELMLNAN